MPEQHVWLEPIRAAAIAIAADQPSLAEWEAGEDGEGEIVDHDVEALLQELGWPTRTRTFTAEITVFGPDPNRTVPHECTETYFPASWLAALMERVAEYVKVRDAAQEPVVPDRLRLRNLPVGADFDALRDLVEGAWDEAGDELACSVALMSACDVAGMDGVRLNLATYLWYGPRAYGEDTPPTDDAGLSYEERLRLVEKRWFPDLRNLPSPKWRAWFADTFADRVAIHDTLIQCGVEATGHLGTDLRRAGYTFDADVSRMTVEELVIRLDARHRFLAAAFRAARDAAPRGRASGDFKYPDFGPKRPASRPASWDAMMETVARLKGENVRWKEIKEQVEAAHGYRSDSGEALRKSFERWLKSRRTPG